MSLSAEGQTNPLPNDGAAQKQGTSPGGIPQRKLGRADVQISALGEGWRVCRVDYVEKESKVLIRVEETTALWPTQSCPHCGRKAMGGYDHAPERRWRHLTVAARPVQGMSEDFCRADAVGGPQPWIDAGV
ncbi:MAG TPA: transposase family protein [Verrucomicrobiae bacterium]|jgi:hypothetical protein|nr:transposase family protein [Verrucomicrobiae bacterium]